MRQGGGDGSRSIDCSRGGYGESSNGSRGRGGSITTGWVCWGASRKRGPDLLGGERGGGVDDVQDQHGILELLLHTRREGESDHPHTKAVRARSSSTRHKGSEGSQIRAGSRASTAWAR